MFRRHHEPDTATEKARAIADDATAKAHDLADATSARARDLADRATDYLDDRDFEAEVARRVERLRSRAQDAAESASTTASRLRSKADERMHEAGTTATALKDRAKERAGEAKERAEEAARDREAPSASGVAATVGHLRDRMAEMLASDADTVAREFARTRKEIDRSSDRLGERIAELADLVRSTRDASDEEIGKRFRDLTDHVDDATSTSWWTRLFWLTLGLGTGAAAAAYLDPKSGPRRREELGSTVQTYVEQARGVAGEKLEEVSEQATEKIGEAADRARDAAGEKISEAKDKAKDRLDEAQSTVEDHLEDVTSHDEETIDLIDGEARAMAAGTTRPDPDLPTTSTEPTHRNPRG